MWVNLLFRLAVAESDAKFLGFSVKRYAISIKRCGYFSELID
jgi:hypothetical protein